MRDIFRKIRDLLDPGEQRKALLLFGMMLTMGLLETAGVGSVLPFVAVVTNPEVVRTNAYLAAIYDGLGFTSTDTFMVFLGGGVFVLVVGTLVFKALTHWAIARYSYRRSYTLSRRLLRGYLDRPYSFFLNRHSADLGKAVLSEVQQVVGGALMPGLKLVANAIVAICLIVLVVAVDPVVALIALVVIGGAYTLIYMLLRHYISSIGAKRVKANRARFQVAQEALGGIKEVKVRGLEDAYIGAFSKPAGRFAQVQASNQIIGELPQFLLQAVMFGGMLLLLLGLLIARKGALDEVLPVVTLYAFAGTRLMPALQHIYKGVTALRFGRPALDTLHRDLVETGQAGGPTGVGARAEDSTVPIPLRESIRLNHVRFAYPGAARPALDDLDITIRARTTVGLVGSTGAGKTTVVDVILGLLEPREGSLTVDGRTIQGSAVRGWQRNIGYVPQSIFLSDDTVTANIAFGVPNAQIDQKAVERAARIAELHEFVVNEMPDGYATVVGERGVRLSGGQRQRIGIARALYHDPDVLVLDEATSALDTVTERSVMDAVNNLGHRKTIIIIAHRLSTVRECDEIFMLAHGRLVGRGRYDELLESNDSFRAMAVVSR